MCPRLEIKLKDLQLANRHCLLAPPIHTSLRPVQKSPKAHRVWDQILDEFTAQESQWRFASFTYFNLISRRGEPHNLVLSNDISRFSNWVPPFRTLP